MRHKKALVMCRTGMGSSMMLKIATEGVIEKNGWPMDVEHDALSGYMGQTNVDVIITMSDLTDQFEGSSAYVIGVNDIMDTDTLERELKKYFDSLDA